MTLRMPHPEEPLVERVVRVSRAWRRFFSDLVVQVNANVVGIAANLASIAVLDDWTDDKWDDLRVPVSSVKLLGGTDPGWGNPTDGLYVLAFDGGGVRDEQVYFVAQMPHAYKEGTDIYPHVHWAPSDANTGNVRWGLEYAWANIGTALPSSDTIYVSAAAGGVANKHQLASFAAISGTGKTISSVLVCRLFRNGSHADDTYNNHDAYLFEFDFHYQRDSNGSDEELSK